MFQTIWNYFRPEMILTLIILFVTYLVNKFKKGRKNLPPGPRGLPVVGYLPFLTKNPHLKFIKLAEEYGSIFSLYLGSQLVVVLNDAEEIRDVLSRKELQARPPNQLIELLAGLKTPFLGPDYKMWQEQRRFVVQSMKDLGLGKSKIEEHIQEEIQYFLGVLEQSGGKPTDLNKPLTSSTSNNITALLFGERYQYDSPDRIVMDHSLENFTQAQRQTGAVIFSPWFVRFPLLLKLLNYETAVKAGLSLLDLIQQKITHHKETLDPQNERDLIDKYLVEMKIRKEIDPDTTFSDESLKGTAMNLFGAGSETVRSSISWLIYVMAAYPEVQKKVQRQIDMILGTSRLPQLVDMKDMMYTQSVVREVMRWQNVVPLNVLRYTLEDVKVGRYHIPRGTSVLANFWSVHRDPKYWKNPEEFQPERFLNPDGTLLIPNYFMPFSVGKRYCPGEAMAMMELFLYFVSILQKFHVSFPQGYKATFEAELGITYRLKPHEICFTLR